MARMCREQHIDADVFALFLRAGVYQAFAGRVISGNAVKKVDSTARDAFRSIGRPQAGTFALADGALTWQVSEEARTAAAKMDAGTQAVFAPQFALDERVATGTEAAVAAIGLDEATVREVLAASGDEIYSIVVALEA